MSTVDRFNDAIRRIDEANREDPRMEIGGGLPQPKELLFSQRVYEWVRKLAPQASEALLLAARAHTLRRWVIPRENFPKTTEGYHAWRNALALYHAQEAVTILRGAGYEEATIECVQRLITRQDFPTNEDARTLEDADCLVFIETKLHNYLDEWDDEKTLRILQQTYFKMTPRGRSLIAQLQLPEASAAILRRAVGG
ncbi:MAG: DUF4202 domain-containing protein [Planctomycetota bacterium]